MHKFLSVVVLYLMSCPALLAATGEMESGAVAPSETVDVIYVVLFGVIFVGMIVAFFVYLWINEKKQKSNQ